MDKRQFTAEDLIADESFVEYYLNTDPEAVKYWQKWISMHPEQIDAVQHAVNLLDLLHIRLPQHELETEKARLTSFISANRQEPVVHTKRIGLNLKYWGSVAAVLAIGIFLALKYIPSVRGIKQRTPVEWTAYSSSKNRRSIITLSDGTRVILNAGSTLSYPNKFESRERLVKLTGQAFFEVAHDAKHPFIVKTNELETRVLGTEFTVTQDKQDQNTRVALLRGSVQINIKDQKDKSLILAPGERIRYNSISHQLQKDSFNEETEAGWRNGLIVFQSADLKTIAGVLQRNYGYELINQSGINNIRYTGKFNNQSPEKIIESICFSMSITYTIQNDKVILKNANL